MPCLPTSLSLCPPPLLSLSAKSQAGAFKLPWGLCAKPASRSAVAHTFSSNPFSERMGSVACCGNVLSFSPGMYLWCQGSGNSGQCVVGRGTVMGRGGVVWLCVDLCLCFRMRQVNVLCTAGQIEGRAAMTMKHVGREEKRMRGAAWR